MKKLVLFLLALLVFIKSAEAQEPVLSNTDLQGIVTSLFTDGCLSHIKNVDGWANKQGFLASDPKKAYEIGPKISFPPEGYLPLNFWEVTGAPVFMVQFQHQGCAVVGDVVFDPKAVKGLMQAITAVTIPAGNPVPAYEQRYDPKRRVYFYMLTLSGAPGGLRTYAALRAYDDKSANRPKTFVYFFRSPQLFKP